MRSLPVAKFTHQPYVSFSGPAVDQKLVGIEVISADHYYDECISSREIMNSGKFGLHNLPRYSGKKRQPTIKSYLNNLSNVWTDWKSLSSWRPMLQIPFWHITMMSGSALSDDPTWILSWSYESDTGFCRLFSKIIRMTEPEHPSRSALVWMEMKVIIMDLTYPPDTCLSR